MSYFNNSYQSIPPIFSDFGKIFDNFSTIFNTDWPVNTVGCKSTICPEEGCSPSSSNIFVSEYIESNEADSDNLTRNIEVSVNITEYSEDIGDQLVKILSTNIITKDITSRSQKINYRCDIDIKGPNNVSYSTRIETTGSLALYQELLKLREFNNKEFFNTSFNIVIEKKDSIIDVTSAVNVRINGCKVFLDIDAYMDLALFTDSIGDDIHQALMKQLADIDKRYSPKFGESQNMIYTCKLHLTFWDVKVPPLIIVAFEKDFEELSKYTLQSLNDEEIFYRHFGLTTD